MKEAWNPVGEKLHSAFIDVEKETMFVDSKKRFDVESALANVLEGLYELHRPQ